MMNIHNVSEKVLWLANIDKAGFRLVEEKAP